MAKPADYNEIKARVTWLGAAAGLDLQSFPVPEIGLELLRVRIPSAGAASRRLFLAAGVHGDEPAAVTAVLQFLEERRREQYPGIDFTIYPCVNPDGFDAGTRENATGDDINRSFHGEGTPESRALRRSLEGNRFDYWIDAHEDYAEDGYYMFAPTDSEWAADVVAAVGKVGPVTAKPEIDEMKIVAGIVDHEKDVPDMMEERQDWPLAFYMIKNFSKRGFTPETPGLLDLDLRVRMQLAAYDAALSMLSQEAAGVATPSGSAAD